MSMPTDSPSNPGSEAASLPLRVLIVEDSEPDAALLVRELQRSGYAPVSRRVATAAELQAALAREAWDIILADYSLPRLNGLDALAIVRASGLDLPFILVSGTIGEETAVEAMKAGAQDYLMKDQLTRLSAAVARELREAVERQARRRAEAARDAAQAEANRELQRSEQVRRTLLSVVEDQKRTEAALQRRLAATNARRRTACG
jgi:DNA-binding NtrC family response regulator